MPAASKISIEDPRQVRRLLALAAVYAGKSREAECFAGNVLPVIRAIEAAGIVSLRSIAAALDARGIPSARGGRWQVSNVRNVLRRQVAG